MPLIYEIEQTFPSEAKLGKYAVKQIERRFHVRLNQNEASGIAMNFVNARYNSKSRTDITEDLQRQYDEILEDTISIVEDEVGILIERNSCSRSDITLFAKMDPTSCWALVLVPWGCSPLLG